EAGVVDAEVVGDLVHDRHLYLLDDVLLGVADGQDRPAEDEDAVGEHAAVVPAALGEGVPLVHPEQVRIAGRRVVLDQDHHVVEKVEELAGYRVERVTDQLLEPVPAHPDRHGQARRAVRVISTADSALETGQLLLVSSAYFWKSASSSPGTSATVDSSILVMPAGGLRCTAAVVSIAVGVNPALPRVADSAIE